MEGTLIPGDKVFVSKLRYGPNRPSSLKNEYVIASSSVRQVTEWAGNKNVRVWNLTDSTVTTSLTDPLKQRLRSKSWVDSVRFLTGHKWKTFDIGPLYVPGKGENIRLNSKNIRLYRDLIEKYENHRISLHDGVVLIDGKG